MTNRLVAADNRARNNSADIGAPSSHHRAKALKHIVDGAASTTLQARRMTTVMPAPEEDITGHAVELTARARPPSGAERPLLPKIAYRKAWY